MNEYTSQIGTYTIIPDAAWDLIEAKMITSRAVMVYGAIASHYNHVTQEAVFPSLARIAARAGCSRDTVIRATKELEELGILKVVRTKDSDGTNKANHYLPQEARFKELLAGREASQGVVAPVDRGSRKTEGVVAPVDGGSRTSRLGVVAQIDSNKHQSNNHPLINRPEYGAVPAPEAEESIPCQLDAEQPAPAETSPMPHPRGEQPSAGSVHQGAGLGGHVDYRTIALELTKAIEDELAQAPALSDAMRLAMKGGDPSEVADKVDVYRRYRGADPTPKQLIGLWDALEDGNEYLEALAEDERDAR